MISCKKYLKNIFEKKIECNDDISKLLFLIKNKDKKLVEIKKIANII